MKLAAGSGGIEVTRYVGGYLLGVTLYLIVRQAASACLRVAGGQLLRPIRGELRYVVYES